MCVVFPLGLYDPWPKIPTATGSGMYSYSIIQTSFENGILAPLTVHMHGTLSGLGGDYHQTSSYRHFSLDTGHHTFLKHCRQGFFQFFCPRGGKMRLHGLLGGGQVRICVQSMWQTRGVRGHALPGIFLTFYYT